VMHLCRSWAKQTKYLFSIFLLQQKIKLNHEKFTVHTGQGQIIFGNIF
jgi:hypothetical protein